MIDDYVVDESSVGQSKAKTVCSFLQELNDAVKAKFIEEYPEKLIESNPSFFSQFSLVVATQVWKCALFHVLASLLLLRIVCSVFPFGYSGFRIANAVMR